jgi:eukaryotic-like serine/threonine-protein kinase
MLGGRYRIVALLGRGGMGEVYRADDLKLGQAVALKFLPRRFVSDPDLLSRFLNEVKTARQIAHPNVCRVYDVGEADGEHFLSMEFVQGEDLATLLRRIGRLPGDKALQIARQLCAGLAAAHERGVIHRDLKPANVMLDERGTARITDFGLAGAAEDFHGESAREGTPAYMAPEQLAGKEATARSDVYSLGLLLYELFTGKPAFSAGSMAELVRLRAQSTPKKPSSHVADMDPAVERAILRCLESDPLKRPASVSLVAAALPGGDPLAAALAAGETPSPEMVAAAGGEGALRPALAWTGLASVVVLMLAALSLTGTATTLGLAPLPKSPDALEERAREVARGFGYTSMPADTSRGWIGDVDFIRYRAQHLPSPARVKTLGSSRPGPFVFLYRQSPRAMIPAGHGITREDPPLAFSGMLSVELDREGRLTRFLAVPPQIVDTAAPPPVTDWTALLAAAGLDPARFHPSPPQWVSPVESDARAAWEGSFSEDPKTIVRAEAAAFGAKPVYFELVGPWSRRERVQESLMPAAEKIANATIIVMVLAVLVLGGVIARRNLRLGRADRAGAFRVSSVLFGLSLAQFLVSGHHAADFGEFISILRAIGEACFWALYIGVMYLALEPYVRRRWPDVLISWSRLLSGRLRDPLVGRDLLIGVVGACIVALNYLVLTALPAWFDIPGLTPLSPDPMSLRGIGGLVGVLLEQPRTAVLIGQGALFLVFLVAIIVRRRGVAIAIVGFILLLTLTPKENAAVELPFVIVDNLVLLVLLFRFGLLAAVTSLCATWAVMFLPLTLDPSRWYFGYGMLGVAIVLGLAIYGFHTSLGGQKALGRLALEDS